MFLITLQYLCFDSLVMTDDCIPCILFLSQFHVINELTEVCFIMEYLGFMWESEFEN